MTVLCYHAVDPDWSAPISVHPQKFAAHAAWLARRRRVLPLDLMVGSRSSGGTGRGRDIAVTFDDGFASIFDHAFPVLMRHAIPATLFVVAGTLVNGGREVDWVDRPPPAGPPRTLSRSQVLEMRDAGVRFGSHSLVHADLTRLGDDECERDLRESRLVLEELIEGPVPFLAYPRGRHDARVRRAAERAGYTHAFGLPARREAADRYSIPRVGVYHANRVRTLRIKTNPMYLPLRSSIGAARRPSMSRVR
jgi:peptidoglycan/xylan/chitin deacetylase (PgdA/CDA1 family)